MSEDWLQTNTAESGEEVDAELMAEYQRELDRHEAARRMVKLKEQEAIEAKKRWTKWNSRCVFPEWEDSKNLWA